MRPSVGDRLRDRGPGLVGRDAERALLQGLLDAEDGPVVVHVHGPGGVGKTALLREVERLAGDRDRPTVWLDAGDVEPRPERLLAALAAPASEVDAPVVGGATAQLQRLDQALPPGAVLVIDRFEVLAGLEHWVAERLVPALPADTLLVIGGRRPPADATVGLVHAGLLEVVPLRNLAPADAEALLRAGGVPSEVDVSGLVEATHGHPLALVIAADWWRAADGERQGGLDHRAAAAVMRHPDPAARLLRRFVDDIDSPLQREALHVAAHARRVDRAVLRAAVAGVEDDATADDLLQWLRDRPYSETHPDGLSLHDVVRDALETDLRWRDPEAFAAMHQRVRSVIVARLRGTEPALRQRAGADLLFLHRSNPVAGALYDYERLGAMTVRPATGEDLPALVALVEREEGPVRAATVAHWGRHQPGSVHVMEDVHGDPVGVGLYARASEASADVRDEDPVARAAWAAVDERRPVAPGELVLTGFGVDSVNPDRLGGVSDLMAIQSLVEWTDPDLGWCVLSSTRGAVWSPVWAYIGFEPLLRMTADDGHEVEAWARDFRRGPFEDWLEAIGAREIDDSGRVPAPVAAPVALSRPDFEVHLREVLRSFHRDDVLATSPLLASALVRRGVGGTDGADRDAAVARLREVVTDAVADLEDDPTLARAARALDRTHLRRASTQEAAAEVLGMPFSTYRRHLARGHEALAAALWECELNGGGHRPAGG